MQTQGRLLDIIGSLGIEDPRVLEAFKAIDRALFVPGDKVGAAYADHPISIGHGQVTTQPSLVARMVGALDLTGSERVLEIGTGLGYQAAILSRLCREVFTIEWFPDLAEQATKSLAKAGITNVHVSAGDGSCGLPSQAPFDAIILAAAARPPAQGQGSSRSARRSRGQRAGQLLPEDLW